MIAAASTSNRWKEEGEQKREQAADAIEATAKAAGATDKEHQQTGQRKGNRSLPR